MSEFSLSDQMLRTRFVTMVDLPTTGSIRTSIDIVHGLLLRLFAARGSPLSRDARDPTSERATPTSTQPGCEPLVGAVYWTSSTANSQEQHRSARHPLA
jgi:hypothetical protein